MSGLARKATEMRHAIDMIEGALMDYGELVDLPGQWEGAAANVRIRPLVTVGQMRRVCGALEECTRIINADEFKPENLKR